VGSGAVKRRLLLPFWDLIAKGFGRVQAGWVSPQRVQILAPKAGRK